MAKTDKKILDLIKEVARRKAEISKIEKPNWRTTCTFSYVEGKLSDVTNLHVETNVKNLVSIVAFLKERETSYEKAAEELGVKAPEFTWQGHSVADWKEDVKMRINKIQIAAKKKELEQLEERLNKIISPELRTELELEAIESLLK